MDEVVEQLGLHRALLLRGGVDMRALAFVALEQALAVHDLHQPQHVVGFLYIPLQVDLAVPEALGQRPDVDAAQHALAG